MAKRRDTKERSEHNLEEEAQKKYLQLQFLKQQLQLYVEEKKLIDQKLEELDQSVAALHSLAAAKPGAAMWTPVGSGSFVAASLMDAKHVLVGIGAGAAVKTTRGEAVAVLEQRKNELDKTSTDVMGQIIQISEAAESIEQDLSSLIEKIQQ